MLIFSFAALFFYWFILSSSNKKRHVYSKKQFKRFTLNKDHLTHSELGLFVALVAKVAKADGRVDELEAQLVSNMINDISTLFPEPEITKKFLKEIFDIEKQIVDNLETIAASLYALLQDDPHKRQKMMEFMVNLAYIDGTLKDGVKAMLLEIGDILDFNHNQLVNMLNQFASIHSRVTKESSLSQAYTFLGISEIASNDELKKAYHELVRKHHPDIIKAQGASDKYLKIATQKVQEINAAYEMIKKSRG